METKCPHCGGTQSQQIAENTYKCLYCNSTFNGVPMQQSMTNQVSPQQSYVGQTASYVQKPARPGNNMFFAIFTTLCCCLPTGIYAIVKASSVNSLYDSGRYNEAVAAANTAKKWCWIGLVCGLVSEIIYIVLQMLGVLAGLY